MLWIASLFLAVGWIYGFGIYTNEELAVAWVYSAIAFVVATGAAVAVRAQDRHSGSVPTILSAWTRFMGVAALQFLFLLLYTRLAVNAMPSEWLAALVSPATSLLGYPSSAQDGIVFVQTGEQVLPFSMTLEKLGFPLVGMLVVPALFLGFSGLERRTLLRRLAWLSAILVVFLYLRQLALAISIKEWGLIDVYWNPALLLVQFLPLALFLAFCVPVKQGPVPSFARAGPVAAFTSVVAVVAFLAVLLVSYVSSGDTKSGLVMIDEWHSDWAWTELEFGPDDYGQRPTYSYSSLKRFLAHYYDVSINNSGEITESLLEGVDVLMLKTPTRPYSESEARAVKEFVSAGGGLLLVGDHTNLFGMTTNINPIAKLFGLRFMDDDTFTLTTGQPTLFRAPRLFPHPATQHVEHFDFQTSCTLIAPVYSEYAMVGYGMGREFVDYGHVNFFGNMKADVEDGYGVFLQAAAMDFGKGRVFAFTDSTVFSNFSLFEEGRWELLLGALDYLNRYSAWDWIRILMALGLAAAVLSAWYRRRLWLAGASVSGSAIGLAVGVALAGSTLGLLYRFVYPQLEPEREYPIIAFERELSYFELPSMIEYRPPRPESSFDTFFVNMQRLGLIPRIERGFFDALASASTPVVFINPRGVVSSRQAERLAQYLHNGGKALFLINKEGPFFATNALLGSIGVGVFPRLLARPGADEETAVEPEHEMPVMLSGMEELDLARDGADDKEYPWIIGAKSVGRGRVVVMLGSEALSYAAMGPVFNNPDIDQRRAYELQYTTIQDILMDGIVLKPESQL